MCLIYRKWCVYSSDKLFQRSREGYFGVYLPSCEATMEIDTKITTQWAQKQFITRVHTLFYFLHDITDPQMTINDDLFTSSPCLACSVFVLLIKSQSIANDAIIKQTIVTQSPEYWYLTLQISILFTAIFTAGRVIKYFIFDVSEWKHSKLWDPLCRLYYTKHNTDNEYSH